MTVLEAQEDSRQAFVGGGPGAMISGVLWLGSAALMKTRGIAPAFAVLFFGGMLIFPLSLLVCRTLLRRSAAQATNPLGRVALESTISMIGGFFAAWLFLGSRPAYVFPLAAVAVGTHYAAFRTVYGDGLFWALAGLITAVGVFDILGYARVPGGSALAVGVLEMVFGAVLTARAWRKRPVAVPSSA